MRTGNDKYALGRVHIGFRDYGPLRREPFQTPNTDPARVMWVFNAERGKVTWVGALRATLEGDVLQLDEDRTLTAQYANDFMTQTFPNIREHVVTRPMQSVYTGPECTP